MPNLETSIAPDGEPVELPQYSAAQVTTTEPEGAVGWDDIGWGDFDWYGN